MSHTNSAIKNENQKHPKVDFRLYLNNTGEPWDNYIPSGMPPELEAELLQNSMGMKRRFRLIAQSMRNRYIR